MYSKSKIFKKEEPGFKTGEFRIQAETPGKEFMRRRINKFDSEKEVKYGVLLPSPWRKHSIDE